MKQMVTIGERIAKILEKKNMTQRELAKMVNVTEVTIGRYINNSREPKGSILKDIADALGVTSDYLLSGKTKMPRDLGRHKDNFSLSKVAIKIPVLGKVAAGIPIEAIEDIEDYEEIPQAMARKGEYFALKIKGHSMEPKFTEGDVVIVKKQNDIESGEIGVVIVNGCDATIKKIIKQENGIVLMATNQDVFPPKFYDYKDINSLPLTILGKVVELRAKF